MSKLNTSKVVIDAAHSKRCVQLREKSLKTEPMDSREETYAAIRKAIAILNDPFTRFLEPARYQALRKVNSGQGVIGVGLEVGADQNNGNLTVCPPMLWI